VDPQATARLIQGELRKLKRTLGRDLGIA
jgi:hypothetical protein